MPLHATEALLVLEDGRAFRGESFGAEGETFGEAVFATGMTGYQETLTDPSYHRQVVVMTAPHVGNTGMNDEDPESERIWVAGYVVRDPARVPSSWRSQRSLDDTLREQGVVGIAGIDTRALTRHLRDRGAMRVGISTTESDPAALLDRVRASAQMQGANLSGRGVHEQAYVVAAAGERRFTVAALDLGIKANTPRMMAARGIETHVLPARRHPRRRAGRRARRALLLQRPGRPGRDHRSDRAPARRPRRRDPLLRDLLRQPAVRPGARASTPTSSATATVGSTSRSSTGPRARSRSPRTTTGSRSGLRSTAATSHALRRGERLPHLSQRRRGRGSRAA